MSCLVLLAAALIWGSTFVVQKWATAAIIMSAEAVFAALAGAVALNERMTGQQIIGALLIFAAVVAVEAIPAWGGRRGAPAESVG